MRERLESLNLLCQVREGGGDARLELLSRFRISPLPNFVLASRNKKCLFGAEATFFDGCANLIPHFGGRVSKTSPNAFSIHANYPFRRWRHCGTSVCTT